MGFVQCETPVMAQQIIQGSIALPLEIDGARVEVAHLHPTLLHAVHLRSYLSHSPSPALQVKMSEKSEVSSGLLVVQGTVSP